jgi:hypothetical protein
MSVLSMSPPELRRAIVVFATGMASAEYRRRHPRASEDDAWSWGIAHRFEFTEDALTAFALMAAIGEKTGGGRPPVPTTTSRMPTDESD